LTDQPTDMLQPDWLDCSVLIQYTLKYSEYKLNTNHE